MSENKALREHHPKIARQWGSGYWKVRQRWRPRCILNPQTKRASGVGSSRRTSCAPFQEFSRQAFAEGALSAKIKQLIAVAVAHTTQCPYCIRGHTAGALNGGASPEEIMEAIWVAAEMRAGAAYAHSTIALDAMREYAEQQR